MKITPLFDNVLIEPIEAEEKTASGIILPDSAKEKPQIGIVKAVGKGKVGQKVMFIQWLSKLATRSCTKNGVAMKSK